MTALRKILIEEETTFTNPVAWARKLYVVANNSPAETNKAPEVEGHVLKNI